VNRNKISVILTTYKREPKVVCRALDSVLQQTYKNYELIVVDDSPESFLARDSVKKEIIKNSIDIHINYIQHEKNLGACAARNTGLRNATGEYIAFLDDDDVWKPDKLEKQITKMIETNAGLIYCKYIFFYEEQNIYIEVERKFYRGYVFKELMKSNFIASTSFPLIKKECFDKCGFFDENLKSSQDYDMWLRIAKCFTVNYVDESLVIYYVHMNDQISKNIQNKLQGSLSIIKKNESFLEENPVLMGYRLASLAPLYSLNNEQLLGMKTLIKALTLAPFNFQGNFKAILRIIKKKY